jgi:DNA-binding transcriptional MerR regulator
MTPIPDLLTTSEVATEFRVHPRTVRQWVERGLLDAITLPSGIKRYRRGDVEAILAGTPPQPAGAA